jgi:hypothetical protein
MVVSPTHRPSLPPGISCYSFSKGWVDPGHMDLSDASEKIPSDTTGERSGTVRLVAQRLNHYGTPGPDGLDLQNINLEDFITVQSGTLVVCDTTCFAGWMAAYVSKDRVAFIFKCLPSAAASTSKRLDSLLVEFYNCVAKRKIYFVVISPPPRPPHDFSRGPQSLLVGRRLSKIMPVTELVIP